MTPAATTPVAMAMATPRLGLALGSAGLPSLSTATVAVAVVVGTMMVEVAMVTSTIVVIVVAAMVAIEARALARTTSGAMSGPPRRGELAISINTLRESKVEGGWGEGGAAGGGGEYRVDVAYIMELGFLVIPPMATMTVGIMVTVAAAGAAAVVPVPVLKPMKNSPLEGAGRVDSYPASNCFGCGESDCAFNGWRVEQLAPQGF